VIHDGQAPAGGMTGRTAERKGWFSSLSPFSPPWMALPGVRGYARLLLFGRRPEVRRNGWPGRSLSAAGRAHLRAYEGVDERVALHLATDEISIGDYVVTGGASGQGRRRRRVPAHIRVVGKEGSVRRESFADGLLIIRSTPAPGSFGGCRSGGAVLR